MTSCSLLIWTALGAQTKAAVPGLGGQQHGWDRGHWVVPATDSGQACLLVRGLAVSVAVNQVPEKVTRLEVDISWLWVIFYVGIV